VEVRETGDVLAGVRETRYDTCANRIRISHEDDRDRSTSVSSRLNRIGEAVHDEDINLEAHEFVGEVGEPFQSAISMSLLDHNVLAFDVAQLLQALVETDLPGLGEIGGER
jgi:hypothetical protein